MKAFAGNPRLKILFLSQRFLFPMDDGGKIRTGKLLEKLKDTLDITLISNVESPKNDPYIKQMEALCRKFYPVPWRNVTKYSIAFYVNIFVKTFSRYPISVAKDYSLGLETAIQKALQADKYDLLVCDFLQPSLNFASIRDYPTLLFQHNVESVIVQRHYTTARNLVSKLFWRLQWKKMERYERQTCRNFSGVIAVSEVDKEIFEQRFGAANVFAIPTGIDTEYFSPRKEPVEENSLVFTGSMDWLPNEDAVVFFAREILGRIQEQIPSVRLTVVGKNPSPGLLSELKKYPAIDAVGWVEDVRPFIGRHTLSVLPLRIGGGTRIKIYESMAMQKTVVSTRVGAEGLPIQDGENIVLADSPEDFAQTVVQLLQNPRKRQQIENTARRFVQENFSWEKAAEAFAEGCWEIVNRYENRIASAA